MARFYDRNGLYQVPLLVPDIAVPAADPFGENAPDQRLFDKPDAVPEGRRRLSLPYIYRDRRKGVETSVVRSLGKQVIQRVSVGHSLSYVRPGFAPTFPPVDPLAAQSFARRVFPRDERISAMFASWSLFTPRYRVYRDYGTYDLREDVQLGPNAFATVVQAPTWLGSDYAYTRVGGNLGWNWDLGGGFQRILTGWGGRFLAGRFVDETRSLAMTLTSPIIRNLGRLVSEADVVAVYRNTRPDSFYTMGGESGLRGYGLNEFRGQARFIAHLEARSRPLALGALRFGGLAFYDVGHAAPSLSALRPHQDVGLGLRLLIPQLNFYVLGWIGHSLCRRGTPRRPGWPGRVSAGFRQVF